MAKANYPHNVIRIRKGKPHNNQVYSIIVILNNKKASSQKVVDKLGFYKLGRERLFVLDYKRLAFYLNKGCILNFSVRKFIYLMAIAIRRKITRKIRKNVAAVF